MRAEPGEPSHHYRERRLLSFSPKILNPISPGANLEVLVVVRKSVAEAVEYLLASSSYRHLCAETRRHIPPP